MPIKISKTLLIIISIILSLKYHFYDQNLFFSQSFDRFYISITLLIINFIFLFLIFYFIKLNKFLEKSILYFIFSITLVVVIKNFFLYSGNSFDRIYSDYFYSFFPNIFLFGIIKYFTLIILCFIIIFFTKNLVNWEKFFLSASLIFSFLFCLDLYQISKVSDTYNNKILDLKEDKKIVLVLLDEFDFHYAINAHKEIKDKIDFNNFFVSTKMFSSGSSTMESLPQILTGLESKNFFEKDNMLYFYDKNNNERKMNYEDSFFFLPHKHRYDLNIISSTINYCKIFKQVKNCKSKENENFFQKVVKAFKYNYSFFSKIEETFFNINLYNKIEKEIKDLDVENLDFIDDKNVFSFKDILDTINNNYGMFYVHLAVPHTDTEKFDSFIYKHHKIILKSNDLRSYDIRMSYSIDLIKSILNKIEGEKNTLVIFFSDHSLKLIKKKNSEKNILFLAKFLDDNEGYIFNRATSTKNLYDIIDLFFLNKIKKNKDLLHVFN